MFRHPVILYKTYTSCIIVIKVYGDCTLMYIYFWHSCHQLYLLTSSFSLSRAREWESERGAYLRDGVVSINTVCINTLSVCRSANKNKRSSSRSMPSRNESNGVFECLLLWRVFPRKTHCFSNSDFFIFLTFLCNAFLLFIKLFWSQLVRKLSFLVRKRNEQMLNSVFTMSLGSDRQLGPLVSKEI